MLLLMFMMVVIIITTMIICLKKYAIILPPTFYLSSTPLKVLLKMSDIALTLCKLLLLLSDSFFSSLSISHSHIFHNKMVDDMFIVTMILIYFILKEADILSKL